jgi:surface polysaccharide O-acyltransferase-like enzyme
MKTRNYGIDFLRMISMIMIVMLHTLGHGGILRSVSFLSVHYQIAWLLEVIAFGAVNTYAMISGFVSVDSHFKISNILILWLQVLFYGILINTVFFFLLPESRNTSGWIQALFPVTRKEYWYFTAYAGVFFLSPFINQMFRNLSEKQIKTLFCFTLVVFSVVPTISQTFTPQQDVFYMGDGYSVFWLTLMYLLGACIKKLNLVSHSKKKEYFILYFFCILITWSSKILVEKFPISGFTLDSSFLIHYTSPFIVLAAISLLLIFGSMNFSESVKKMIMLISPLSFGVYLLHDHPLVRSYVMTDRFAFITNGSVSKMLCSRSKFLSKLLKTFDKTFREIFPVFISTKRREKPSAFFDNNFVNNAYFSEAASSSSSHLASASSKAPISSRMTCLCLWSS